jgi:hypothetical protein
MVQTPVFVKFSNARKRIRPITKSGICPQNKNLKKYSPAEKSGAS